MTEIDNMDMIGYLRLRAWKLNKEEEKKKPKRADYIDDIWPTWM